MTAFIQRSFSGGEISPSLYARADMSKYATGLRKCRNFAVARHGGLFNRPGTQFIGEVKTSSKTVKLIPFVFNAEQTYILEFGDLYMRVYHDGAVVTSGLSIYEIVTPYVEADLQTLQFAQSADVMTIVHPSYAPRELSRTGHAAWTLTTITPSLYPNAPSAATITTSTAGTETVSYVVTAEYNGEESVASNTATDTTCAEPSASTPVTINWTDNSGTDSPVLNHVYRIKNGAAGYIGTVDLEISGTEFKDTGFTPDFTSRPPINRDIFASSNYPSSVGLYQQRRIFGGSNNNPETVYSSKIGFDKNFSTSFPSADDDAVTFSLSGKYVNQIRHIIELQKLIILTSGSEWTIEGDGSGALTPTAINARQQAYNGSSSLPPLIVNGTLLYNQSRGSIIRDMGFDFSVDGYRGNDLTIFSAHLFDSYTIRDWTYQQIPHSIVWVVRSDGALLGLTYVREHEMLAWHRHDFVNGTVEQAVCIPEGSQDSLYLVIKRTINGVTKRYIERLISRRPDEVVDMTYMDCYLTYDGRNTGATTMTMSGSGWTSADTLTMTASSASFTAGDIGNAIHVTGPTGDIIRFLIEGYTSTTVVTGRPHKTVPTDMRTVAFTTWAKAVDTVTNLSHLEGQNVSVFGDGFVVASPNNSLYSVRTVSGNQITLDRPYAVIHVGLPITSDMETLDIETTQSETFSDKQKLVNRVTMFVESSRGIWVGGEPPTDDTVDPLEGLSEMNLRDTEAYDVPDDLETGPLSINIKAGWNSNGRIFVRQVDPVPLSILAVVPTGFLPVRG